MTILKMFAEFSDILQIYGYKEALSGDIVICTVCMPALCITLHDRQFKLFDLSHQNKQNSEIPPTAFRCENRLN